MMKKLRKPGNQAGGLVGGSRGGRRPNGAVGELHKSCWRWLAEPRTSRKITEPKTCLMTTRGPIPQSPDGGALLKEWKDELPPAGASECRCEARQSEGLARPRRRSARARAAGGGHRRWGFFMNPIGPMNPMTSADVCDSSSQSDSSSASGSCEAPQARPRPIGHATGRRRRNGAIAGGLGQASWPCMPRSPTRLGHLPAAASGQVAPFAPTCGSRPRRR